MKYKHLFIFAVIALAAFTLAACAGQGAKMPTVQLPAGKAYAEGKEIFFIHTEASDAKIADLLSKMMSSPVLFTPKLAQAPEGSLAEVYVFDNGLKGGGPLGFQADVFNNPPGAAGYSPLRRLNVVSWAQPEQARELKSAADVQAAKAAGEVTIAQPGVVINMPFVVWDGGKR